MFVELICKPCRENNDEIKKPLPIGSKLDGECFNAPTFQAVSLGILLP